MAQLTLEEINTLKCQARSIRCDVVSMITEANSGHPGGSLSAADIVTTLYFAVMNVDAKNPMDPDRDRFVLSKGHAAPVLYAALAAKGYFPREELMTLRKINSRIQGHPSRKDTPGIDISTGSLGQGISTAVGMALGLKLDGKKSRVFSLLGDGELEEGQVWEAAMAAAHYKLNNLTAFVDYNGLQIDGPISSVLSPEPIADKWRAFGWHVLEIDGHDIGAIYAAVEAAKAWENGPTMIIAATVKGKGVCKMENVAGWHGKAPTAEECKLFLTELED